MSEPEMRPRMTTVHRRHLLWAAGAGIVLASGAWLGAEDEASAAIAAQNQSATPAANIVGSAKAPDWTFIVHSYHDPYQGQIQVPKQAPPQTRYVAAEIEIDNNADQPLNFNPADVRVRDGNGTEYRGGSALGTEPFVSARNLNGGERSRGWIWFTVTAGVQLVELAYLGPQPEFRIDLTK